ncbi:hypothetical protein HAP32_02937 [Serratia fonticola]|jgi:hypothetical protein|nr:hypothetical protein HAP32_02937 [Serratia fonticola]
MIVEILEIMIDFVLKYVKIILFTIFFNFLPTVVVVLLYLLYLAFIPEYSGRLLIISIIVVFYLSWKYIPDKYT